ncbi:hypothetical protein RB195_007463 [Necator americanus]|uniref:rRNA adenine N(6)-methyltransferase n=1 Tax=Necator americanus TaxID=51031 RepID=A0ABR1C096_NECAM
MNSYSYPSVMYQSRTAQLICVTLQILLLYSYIDHLSTARFFITMALCLYNLFITGMRWSKNIDGRFDFRQMLKEKNTQLKLSYAREVFGPLVIGFLVFLMIRLPECTKEMATSFSRLPPLPPLRDFIHMYRLRAKKVLSQNYLMDMNLTRKIVRSAGVQPGDWVCEVGPGPGGITRAILESSCDRLDVVEIDKRFIPPLEHLAEAAEDRLHIHHGDVLKTNIGEFWSKEVGNRCREWNDNPPPMHIIGNLPFNIASPLIIKLLKDMSYRSNVWRFGRVPLTLTFQMEVAKRICSPIDDDARSRLSIMAQYLTEPKLLFTIPGTCFVPPPEVNVGVVRFLPRAQPLINVPFEVVEKLCRQVFHYRQKYIIKGLKTLYPKEIADEMAHQLLKACRVNPKASSVQLGVEEFADLASGYEKQCQEMPGLFPYDYIKPKRTVEILAKTANALPPTNPFLVEKMPGEGIRLTEAVCGSFDYRSSLSSLLSLGKMIGAMAGFASEPLAMVGGANSPIAMAGGANTPIAMAGGANAPIAMAGGANTPTAMASGANTPTRGSSPHPIVTLQPGMSPQQTGPGPVVAALMQDDYGAQPLQGIVPVWMPVLDPIPGVPTGLEYLAMVDTIMIFQQMEPLEFMTGYEISNKYRVTNAAREQIYFAVEESAFFHRKWYGNARPFTMHVIDNAYRDVMIAQSPKRIPVGGMVFLVENNDLQKKMCTTVR